MPSRSPSRRSSPLTPRSRVSSHRSPSFGMRGTSRRGRSPPSDARRRRILPRGGGTRTGESSVRGQRSSEFRNAPRRGMFMHRPSIPPGSYPQGQYSAVSTQQGSHSPRRATVSKRHSFSPSISVMPSTSGLKRKHIPRPRSSSTSSSSLNTPPRPQHRHHQVIKVKKISVERIAASREPPATMPIRKRSRSKSPIRERSHVSRATSRFNVRGPEGNLDGGPVAKGSSYSVAGRAPVATVTSRGFAASPRRHENPQKRFMTEPVVRYGGVGDDESRPVYRGPDGPEPASYSDRELKKITVGIRRSLPIDEAQINRQIVNPEDVVVVRRPDGGLAGAEGIQGEVYRLVNVRTDSGEIVQALSRVLPNEVDMGDGGRRGGFQNAGTNGCQSNSTCEGSRPIFEREELHQVHHSGDDVEDKYEDRERRTRRLYRSPVEEHPRVVAQQQPIEQRVVAIIDEEPVQTSSSRHSLRGQVHRSRSPLPTVSRSGGSRFESISPPPYPPVGMERQRRRAEAGSSYYNFSPSPPPHSRVVGGFGAGTGRSRDYEQAGPSHAGTSSQTRHKDGRRNEDLRYELEYRRRDDASYERGSREFRADSDGASSDLRMRINEKRTTDHHRASHYHGDEEGTVIHTKVVNERGYTMEHHHADVPHDQKRRGMERGGGHRMGGHPQREDIEHEEFQPRGSFHNKANTSSAPPWDGNPEFVPKGRAYYEHDNRDEEWVRMGGGPRGGRGGHYTGATGNRGRFFRGGFIPRGRGRGRGRIYYINRGGYMRGGGSGGGMRRSAGHAAGMGGGNSSRGKPSSPSLWKHDMFENLSSDENRPTSTTSETKR